MVSQPKAPDPYETAAAQATYNQQTAATTQAMNMVDQYSPTGTSIYNQTGTQTIIGADGKPIQVPKYSQTTTYSDGQQAIFDQTEQAQSNLAGLAVDQSAAMSEYLNTPFEYNNQDAENWAYDLASPRILDQQGQNEASLRTTLANKGIREGSEAWKSEMNRLTQGNSDQLNQLALTGRGQAFNEALTTRNQPINELSALLSGSQIAAPSFSATPSTGVAGVDYTGLANQQYQSQVQSANATNGGLFGLLGTGLSLFSDPRLKMNIRRVGATDSGTPIYTYQYIWGGPVQMGVMATDVPEAAEMDPSGFMRVNYGKVA